MKKLMHFLAKIFPNSKTGENPVAVKMFYRMNAVKHFFKRVKQSSKIQWPLYSGNYRVLNPQGHIAVCSLTSDNLMSEIFSDEIAIIGTVVTPNLGIERIILNTISNPNIRHLVLCGKDSPIFKAGQAIECLFKYGIDKEKRIINADGHFPVLKNLSEEKITHFLNQIELIDIKNEREFEVINEKIAEINLNSETFKTLKLKNPTEKELFNELKPGGKRVPLDYDQKGFFVITVENNKREITVKHYFKNNQPGFIIKGHSSESILLAILEKNLVSQMSHAGYLGAELTKAETALKLNLKYVQDQSLKYK
ncbi:DUF4346 domain-containing protein [Lutimonas vermicola]|uniref:DUF4346 domain-containing protein n=1 Tax=Lutimonas vermicola TaxID=414288 RepID=A0ABU9L279_9FLAO